MKTKNKSIKILIFFGILLFSCSSNEKEVASTSEKKTNGSELEASVIEMNHNEQARKTGSLIDLYKNHSRDDFITYDKVKNIGSFQDFQIYWYQKYRRFFNNHSINIILPYDFILNEVDFEDLIYDSTDLKYIEEFNFQLEKEYKDSINHIFDAYKAYTTSDTTFEWSSKESRKIISEIERNVRYKGDHIASETRRFFKGETIAYSFTGKGFNYEYEATSNYRAATLDIKHNESIQFTPFWNMDKNRKSSSTTYNLFGNDRYQLNVNLDNAPGKKIVQLSVWSRLKASTDCIQSMVIVDPYDKYYIEYKNGVYVVPWDEQIMELDFKHATYKKYDLNRGDTMRIETGIAHYDDICTGYGLSYVNELTSQNYKVYDRNNDGHLYLKEEIIYDKNGDWKQRKTFWPDGSINENINY